MTAARIALIIANFTNLNAVIFGDYLDHAVPDAFYQHIDVVKRALIRPDFAKPA